MIFSMSVNFSKIKTKQVIAKDKNYNSFHRGDDDFRPSFNNLGRLRAIIAAPFLSVTATATEEIRASIKETLHMEECDTLYIEANRNNICYSVKEIAGLDMSVFDSIIQKLNDPSVICPKVIVYCSVIDVVASVFLYFRHRVPHPGTMSCPVAMFHKSTASSNKSYVLSEFPRPESTIRVVIATVAFGLGINIKDIKTVINYGLPLTFEEFVQESGRAGRNGDPSESILYHSGALRRRGTTAAMLDYMSKDVVCRQRYIAQYFKLSNVKDYTESEAVAKSVSPCCDLCSAT